MIAFSHEYWTQITNLFNSLTEEAPLEGGQPASRGRGVPAPEFAGGAADEDVVGRGVDHPVVALAGVVVVTGNLQGSETYRPAVTGHPVFHLFCSFVIP